MMQMLDLVKMLVGTEVVKLDVAMAMALRRRKHDGFSDRRQ